LIVTCFIRYEVDPEKLDEFEEYARAWIPLIEKYGGTHHGYFMPGRSTDKFPDPTFSFPGLGTNGPDNFAVALFSFPDLETYHSYRKAVSEDPDCKAARARFNETKCFSSYERNFLKPILREDVS
jgi:NIPSNAP